MAFDPGGKTLELLNVIRELTAETTGDVSDLPGFKNGAQHQQAKLRWWKLTTLPDLTKSLKDFVRSQGGSGGTALLEEVHDAREAVIHLVAIPVEVLSGLSRGQQKAARRTPSLCHLFGQPRQHNESLYEWIEACFRFQLIASQWEEAMRLTLAPGRAARTACVRQPAEMTCDSSPSAATRCSGSDYANPPASGASFNPSGNSFTLPRPAGPAITRPSNTCNHFACSVLRETLTGDDLLMCYEEEFPDGILTDHRFTGRVGRPPRGDDSTSID